MKALVFEAPEKAVVADLDRPEIGPDEVLVRSHAVGICHSDFELYAGRYIIPVRYPIIPGHEWSGEIVEAGADVVGLAPRATAWWASAWSDPRAATTSASPSAAPTPSTSAPAASGCTSCPTSCPTKPAPWWSRSAWPTTPPTRRAGSIPPTRWRSSAAGPIGLLCVAAAAAHNATVTLIEPQQSRRAAALDLGARHALDPDRERLHRRRGRAHAGPRL